METEKKKIRQAARESRGWNRFHHHKDQQLVSINAGNPEDSSESYEQESDVEVMNE